MVNLTNKPADIVFLYGYDKWNEPKGKNVCLLNFAGYFPGVGVVAGIFRIYSGINGMKGAERKYKVGERYLANGLIGRGIVEIIGLGSLFIIPDIFITIYHIWEREHPAQA